MNKQIDVVFITKAGCGICMMMEPAWKRIMTERLDWHCYHYNIGVDAEAIKAVTDFPQNDGKLPMFCVYDHNKPLGIVSGGHRYKDIIRMIEEIVNVSK